ncbi:hypothetical protein BDB00DRAFT_875535 [Zychaea mexicana]|uniref:uncharacterized protein n=1 Tax=Zychaea mexicana TaxID=64656 RepID=UPI0022FECD12|nr:uncharacterized protein BDB00DRAFT_875535 [Zychaea mexicana]KAI9490209.1 hypothetical protein BDB00DRAFT_875535 [Zychaea mexicana]
MLPSQRQSSYYARRYSGLLVSSILLQSQFSYEQDDDYYDDGYDDGDDGSADETDDGSNDDCSLISGHTCNANGICKYCAMCLQSSCIWSKSVSSSVNNTSIASPSALVCNTTQFDTPDVYDWYGYCLSSGNDSDGDYCATSSECYQYRRNATSSVSHIWNNLTCEPSNCLLMTDRGQPPPAPGQLPTESDGSGAGDGQDGDGVGAGAGHRHHAGHGFTEHSPSAIALMVTCSFIFLVGMIWMIQMWMKSKRTRQPLGPPFSWIAFCLSCGGRRKKRVQSLASNDTTVPSTAPPSFRSNQQPEMQQRRVASSSASSLGSQSSQQPQNRGEPLPSYYSPDPSPPKYEQAIVTQIRGLMGQHALIDDNDGGDDNDGQRQAGHNSLPPPLWLPVYFTPNHSAYSFGRLRRHPPPHMAGATAAAVAAVAASSSSSSSPSNNNNNIASSSSSNPHQHQDHAGSLWHHNNDWSDPLQAFWYHHQQQIGQPRPSPSTSSPAAVDLSTASSATQRRRRARENSSSLDDLISRNNDDDDDNQGHVNNSSSFTAGLR